MHPCLCVDEILRLVAHELATSGERAAALALACCCKKFEDPVLDALWETQEQLLPFRKILVLNFWEGGICTVSTSTTHAFPSFTHLVWQSTERFWTTPQWARFQKYARKMRRLVEYGSLGTLLLDVLWALQLHAINEPLFPNLKTLELWPITEEFIPFIPMFLSPRTTAISIGFNESDLPVAALALMIATFPSLCPNLRDITLRSLPRDPTITAAVSGMLLAANRDTLQHFHVSSPLTEEAREVIHKLPDLRGLSVVIERDASLPSLVLPNLVNLIVKYDHDGDGLRMFRGATFGKLEAVTFHARSERIGNFLEAFERVALVTSIQNTLSTFYFRTSCWWTPNYHSLLPFTQLRHLVVGFSCDVACSSTVDDDVVTNLARTMPRLEILRLGNDPCGNVHTGVTAKGLVVLAHHCPNLSTLRIHFQAAGLTTQPMASEVASNAGSAVLQRDCALRILEVGKTPMVEELVSTVAMTLARIFPRMESVQYVGENWYKVVDAIRHSRQIIDYTGKEHPFCAPRSGFNNTSPGATLEGVV